MRDKLEWQLAYSHLTKAAPGANADLSAASSGLLLPPEHWRMDVLGADPESSGNVWIPMSQVSDCKKHAMHFRNIFSQNH